MRDSVDQPPGGGQRGSHHLVHIVVAVLRQPADEGHVRLLFGQCFIALVERLIPVARHRIVGFAISLWILAYDGRAGVLLSRQMPEFGDARIGVIVRIVERAGFLETIDAAQVLMLEAE